MNSTMNKSLLLEFALQHEDPDNPMVKMDGYDDCVAGVCIRFGQVPILCYDRARVIQKLMKDMTEEEAEEWFGFNQMGAWVGETTPCFIVKP